MALPFGTCERVLQDSSNKQAATALDHLQASLVRDLVSCYRQAASAGVGMRCARCAAAQFGYMPNLDQCGDQQGS